MNWFWVLIIFPHHGTDEEFVTHVSNMQEGNRALTRRFFLYTGDYLLKKTFQRPLEKVCWSASKSVYLKEKKNSTLQVIASPWSTHSSMLSAKCWNTDGFYCRQFEAQFHKTQVNGHSHDLQEQLKSPCSDDTHISEQGIKWKASECSEWPLGLLLQLQIRMLEFAPKVREFWALRCNKLSVCMSSSFFLIP